MHIYLENKLCIDLIELSREGDYYQSKSYYDSDDEEDPIIYPKTKQDKILYKCDSKWTNEFIKNKYLHELLEEHRFLVFEEDNNLKFNWNRNDEEVINITEIIKHERIQYD